MRQVLYNKLFPTPKYLVRPAYGIDLSDRSLKYVELKRTRRGFEIPVFGRVPVPEGLIERGIVQDVAQTASLLKEVSADWQSKFVRVALPEEQAFLFKARSPQIEPNEIRENLMRDLEKYVPISVQDAVFDFDIVRTIGRDYLLQVVAFPREVVYPYLDAFTQADLVPLSFEIEAQAIARSVIGLDDHNTYMIVDFGKTRTGLAVVSEGHVFYAVTLDIAGSDFTQAIADEYKITPKKAEALKVKHGLTGHADLAKVQSRLMKTVDQLANEITRNSVFWTRRKKELSDSDKDIAKIILCGGNATMSDLVTQLQGRVGTPIQLADAWVNIQDKESSEHAPEIKRNDSFAYVGALGLALGSHIH